jgi:BirA family biotin operon repressor/biotin-[acetyl-CoA-carboxylase] ligase
VNDFQSLDGARWQPGYAWHVRYLEETESTQDEVWAAWEPHVIVVAGRQRSGRGRRGNRWESAPGSSLLFSVGLEGRGEDLPWAMMAAAFALADAIGAVCAAAPVVKWPNDVLLNGAKCAGILLETRNEGGELRSVLGVGVNLTSAPEDLPEGALPATSLAGAGCQVPGPVLLRAWVDAFDGYWRGIRGGRSLQDDARRRLATLGTDVQLFRDGAVVAEGRAVDVDGLGRLVVEAADGSRSAWDAGDVRSRRVSSG